MSVPGQLKYKTKQTNKKMKNNKKQKKQTIIQSKKQLCVHLK